MVNRALPHLSPCTESILYPALFTPFLSIFKTPPGSTFKDAILLLYFRNNWASTSCGTTYPGIPTATGFFFLISLFWIPLMESARTKRREKFFFSSGPRRIEVGVFHCCT